MLLSIIIPCYNSEKYLYSTISSIENEIADCQSYHTSLTSNDFELIVINDGCTDKTSEIIESLCFKFDNIKVINQSNKGQSASRNVGLKSAKGDYVHFIDSDDMLFAGAYKHLISSILPPTRRLEKDFNGIDRVTCRPDIVKFSSVTVDHKTLNNIDNFCNNNKNHIFYSGTLREYINRYAFQSFAWGMLYSRKLLLENDVYFADMSPCEDIHFNVRLGLKCPDAIIVATNLNVYKYLLHEGSIVTSYTKESIQRAVNRYMLLWDEVNDFMADKANAQYFDKLNDVRDHIPMKVLTRLLSANIDNTNSIISQCRVKSIFPIARLGKLNTLIYNRCSFCILRLIYRYIFLPYIKPYIGRN